MKLEIIYKSVDEIIPYVNNPRRNENAIGAVASSIKNFGFKNPIILDKDNEIVAGHTRLLAAKRLGIETVPCVIANDLTPAQIKAFRLVDNKVAEIAEWDNELLKLELEDVVLDLPDIEFEMIGFDLDFLEDTDDAVEDDFDIDGAITENPKSKLGDVYQLGRHRLMCGDSTKREDVQKLVGGGAVDLFLTDPPYGVDYTGKTDEALKIINDKLEDDEFTELLLNAFKNAHEVMKPGAVFYIWHADTKGLEVRHASNESGLQVRQCIIWNKNTLVMGRQDYQWKHEPCLYGWKEGAAHLWASDRRQTTVLEFDKPTRSAEHPTMKPVPLFDYLIKNNTKGEDIVLDLFGGSGTTIIACEQNGRIGYMMEYDPVYADVIIKRWEALTGEKAVLLDE